jgi:hypothetical protein
MFDWRNLEIDPRRDRGPVRLQKTFPSVRKILKNTGVKAESSDLIRQDDVHFFGKIHVEGMAFDENHPILKTIGAANGSRHLDDSALVNRVNPLRANLARQQPQDSCSSTQIQNDIAWIYNLSDGLTKGG